MSKVSMRNLFESGAHFGHRSRYWNPKMAPYIYGTRGDIHIINLEKTVTLLEEANNFLGTVAANGGTIMFVGTKRAASGLVEKAAKECSMPYVSQRWLGGMMTNYQTIKQSVRKLHNMRKADESGDLDRLTKKEALTIRKKQAKLELSLGGIAEMKKLPDVLFVADVGHEKIAIQEARVLGIPIVGIVDTNNNPEDVDYIIPANDDSVRTLECCINSACASINDARGIKTVAKEIQEDSKVEEKDTEEANSTKEANSTEE